MKRQITILVLVLFNSVLIYSQKIHKKNNSVQYRIIKKHTGAMDTLGRSITKLVEENFPIEKLQAMIDK